METSFIARSSRVTHRVHALALLLAMLAFYSVSTVSAFADDPPSNSACNGAFNGSPEGSLAKSTDPAGGTEASPASITAGTQVDVTVTWDPADWTDLDQLFDCVEINGQAAPGLTGEEKPPQNDGVFTHSYTIPSDLEPGAVVCDRARLSGQPTGDNTTTQKSNIICFRVVEPEPEPDLSVTKTSDASPPVEPGASFDYTITATNDGDAEATNVAVTDTLDTGLTFVSSADGCTESGGVVTCNLGNIAGEGGTASATFTVSTQAETCTTYVNDTYDATADNHDTVAGTDTVSVEANDGNDCEPPPEEGEPDLTIAKSSDASDEADNGSWDYTITVSNPGDEDATGVTVSDTIANGLTIDEANVTPAGCTVSGQDVDCDLGTLGAGDSVDITIPVTASDSDEVCAYDNSASANADHLDEPISDSADTVNTDASECDTTPPPPDTEPDLAVSKTSDASPPVEPGSTFAYTITVTNSGDGAATNVVVTDTLDTGLTFVSGAGCTESASVVTCEIGDIAAGSSDSATFSVLTLEETCTTYVNDTYDASADNHDTVAGTDTVSVEANDGDNCIAVLPDVEERCLGDLQVSVHRLEDDSLIGPDTISFRDETATLVDGLDVFEDLDCGPVTVTLDDFPDGWAVVGSSVASTEILDGQLAEVKFVLDQSEVRGIVVDRPEPDPAPQQLPATGLDTGDGRLLGIAAGLFAYGFAILWSTRKRAWQR